MKKSNNHKKENDRALVPLTGNLPVGVSEEQLRGMLQEDMKRTGEDVIPRLPMVKILHAGALMFELPPDETGKKKRVETFEGIIIDKHRCNAWWEKSFSETGGGIPPDCASLNARFGIIVGGDTIDCATCPHNQFGTAIDPKTGVPTKGKACKNMMRLHIMVDGHQFPWRLTLPPTSLKEADTFFCALIDRSLPMTAVKVRFSLNEALSSQGIEYSQIRFEQIEQIPIEQYLKIKEFLRLHLAQIRGQEIIAEEYNTETNNQQEEETPEGNLEDLIP